MENIFDFSFFVKNGEGAIDIDKVSLVVFFYLISSPMRSMFSSLVVWFRAKTRAMAETALFEKKKWFMNGENDENDGNDEAPFAQNRRNSILVFAK